MGSRNTMGVSIFDGINLPGGRAGELLSTTGRVFYVGSVAVPGGVVGVDSAELGDSPRQPYATWDFAYNQVTASRGDVICVLPNHAETTTGLLTFDTAGITTVGLGVGRNRPTITTSATAVDGITITGAANTIYNMRILQTASITAFVNVAAADFTLENCYLDGAAVPEDGITVTAAGDRMHIKGCYFYSNANGPNIAVKFEGKAIDWIIEDCIFNYATAGIDEGMIQSSFKCEGGVFRNSVAIGVDTIVFDFNSSLGAQGDGIISNVHVVAGAAITNIDTAIDAGGYHTVGCLISDLPAATGSKFPLLTPA